MSESEAALRVLVAQWRKQAGEEKAAAREDEDEGHSVWSNGHSGEERRLKSCAADLEAVLGVHPLEKGTHGESE